MDAKTPRFGTASMVLVAIDEIQGDTCISGRIFSEYVKTSIPFDNLAALMFKVDGLLDSLCAPQSSFELRGKAKAPTPQAIRKNPPKRFDNWASIARERPDGLAVVLHILYRQHASWQGYMYLTGGKPNNMKRAHFRSAMEALHTISSLCRAHIRDTDLQKGIG